MPCEVGNIMDEVEEVRKWFRAVLLLLHEWHWGWHLGVGGGGIREGCQCGAMCF